jgi:hypothetical protein
MTLCLDGSYMIIYRGVLAWASTGSSRGQLFYYNMDKRYVNIQGNLNPTSAERERTSATKEVAHIPLHLLEAHIATRLALQVIEQGS